MTTLPLERDQLVTVDGRQAVITDVHGTARDTPRAYTVRFAPGGDEDGVETRRVGAEAVTPVLLDLEDVDTKLAEASGHIDNPEAIYSWPSLQAMRTADALRAEVGYLRRRQELAEEYTRLGPRDGAIAAGAEALLDLLRGRGELDGYVDATTTEEMLALAEAVLRGALPVLAPFADALQELHDILPGPCPVPDAVNGEDQCAHGTWDQCPVSRAAWIAAGLDPGEEKRRLVHEYRRAHMPVDPW